MHNIVNKIRSLLDENNIEYKFFTHKEGSTSVEMQKIRKDFSLKEGAKALILKTDKEYIQTVIPGDKRFSNKKLKDILKSKNIRFAKEEQLKEITEGIQPGGIPPFGSLFNLKVYVDENIFNNEYIVFNCGVRTASIRMKTSDYKKITNPIIKDITD